MPFFSTSEQYGRMFAEVRRLRDSTGALERDLETLVQTTEDEVSEVTAALLGTTESSPAPAAELETALRAQLQRSRIGVDTARRLCEEAHNDHEAVGRLLGALEAGQDGVLAEDTPRHTAVLVVDDRRENRELVSRLLREAGFHVRTASNGLEAIIAAYEMRPAVIVMDVSMPVLDGFEATRLIKAIDVARHARVIAYTAYSVLDELPGRRLFHTILVKPAPPELLVSVVQRCAEH